MKNKANEQNKTPAYMQISKPANLVISLLFIILALISVIPTAFCFIISLSSETSIAQNGYRFIPSEWSLDAYVFLWEQRSTIGNAFLVSFFITVVGTGIGLILNTSLAYAISRNGYKLKKALTIFIIIPMLFQGGMVSSYMINTQMLGLKNSIWSLILPLAVSTWYIMILNTFFRTSVPDSLIESAKIDGASQLVIFARIVLPISLPVLATIGLFLTFLYWNDWFQAMLYINSKHQDLYPLQYVLVSIQNNIDFISQNPNLSGYVDTSNIPSETARMAIVMVIVLPIACAYPFFQRYFVSGLTVGAVKG
ncbi:MAG: carbohydrate ABC transporter permease [Oscillospiraceae bacterium]|nr:carbohydrate ABC transporter permease [Oscillospiraceae bacterium]